MLDYHMLNIIFEQTFWKYRIQQQSSSNVHNTGPIMHNFSGHFVCFICNSSCIVSHNGVINTLRPRQNGRHFPNDIFKCIFLNDNIKISIKISLKFVPKGPVKYIPALVQIMAWRRPGDKPFSEPMMISLLTHICVTLPQWVKCLFTVKCGTPHLFILQALLFAKLTIMLTVCENKNKCVLWTKRHMFTD